MHFIGVILRVRRDKCELGMHGEGQEEEVATRGVGSLWSAIAGGTPTPPLHPGDLSLGRSYHRVAAWRAQGWRNGAQGSRKYIRLYDISHQGGRPIANTL